jgi:hypothetical protein
MFWRFRSCGLQLILGCLQKEGQNVKVTNIEGTTEIVREFFENYKSRNLGTVSRIILKLIIDSL